MSTFIALVTIGALFLAAAADQLVSASRTLLATVMVGNRPTVDVDLDDLVIEESGTAREVLDVHIADYPLVVLVDDSPSIDERTAIREAAARFVSRVGERAIAFGTLDGPMRAGFDDEREKVLAEIRSGATDPSARLKPLDAVHAAARLIQESGSAFAAMIIVSARPIEPGELESSELLSPILESRVPVHVVAHRSTADASQNDPDVLREVANLTRGQFTTIYTTASYSIALDRLADRLSTEMMIQFLVPAGSSGGDVKVGVKVPGARVVGLGVSR